MNNPPRPSTQEKRTMLYWLAQACKSAREAAGLRPAHIAVCLNKDPARIYDFERGELHKWPRETDRFVTAYAECLKIANWNLWEEGLQLAREHGTPARRVEDYG